MKPLLLTAAALVAIAGTAAVASNLLQPTVHEYSVASASGGAEEISIADADQPQRIVFAGPSLDDPFPAISRSNTAFVDPGLAMMVRMTQQMNAFQANADRLMASTMNLANAPVDATLKNLPGGPTYYSFVSTVSTSGGCMRAVRITSRAGEAKPQVVSQTSGNCADAKNSTPSPAISHEQPAQTDNGLINIRAMTPARTEPPRQNL